MSLSTTSVMNRPQFSGHTWSAAAPPAGAQLRKICQQTNLTQAINIIT